jgi:hypothetical protein
LQQACQSTSLRAGWLLLLLLQQLPPALKLNA